jgi:hypothetical protein
MVTRSEAIERMAKMACFRETPCVPCVEDAEPYLDALLDYIAEEGRLLGLPLRSMFAQLRGEE